MGEQMEAFSVRFDTSLKEGIRKAADKSRRKVADYIRLVLEDAVREGKKV